jgi:uncharacterized repeat protein (TIGR02543 family)
MGQSRLCLGKGARCYLAGSLVALATISSQAAVLFEDDFNRGIPGWTAIQPAGAYLDGPLRWQYDIVSGGFVETSNLYTDNSTFSPSSVAPMLINDTQTAVNFTYSARLTAGDDDGFGLIFGYSHETDFYRVTFARQTRSGFPWTGWSVDQKVEGISTILFGAGTPGYVQTFVNTANRPFDVTIVVDTQNRLTLTVVDNPTVSPTTYSLVVNQPLPGPANGQVGLMTWGMSGATPKGFRIQNLSLSPAGLAGNPNALTNWTSVVPPRASGSTALSGGNAQPLWSLSVGPGGPYGTLVENSDCLGGNDAAGQVDFTGPTLVAGDVTWTNYVVATRIIPADDDGHGILVRYQNSTNFYRIALRSQSSTTGPFRGLSIQKNINRTYTEVFHENSVQYDPLPGIPYDLVATISNTSLQVLVVSDPEGAAQPYNYGPFTVTGLSSGKIGLFSWAMAQTEFDFVSVQSGTALYVSSPFGTPNPAKGLTGFAPGSLINATAGVVVTNEPGIRRLPTGWTGSGSVPASGSASNVNFTLNTVSHLHWLWRTEYHLAVTNGPGGTVSAVPAEWLPEATNVTLVAQADNGFVFAGWTGDLLSTSPTLNFSMTQPYTLVATFAADSDGDGLPDSWELAYFGTLLATPGGDPDGDGRSNLQEFRDGTNPLVPDIFRIESLRLVNNQSILTISNNTGTRYGVQNTISLPANWATIGTTQFANTFTSALPSSSNAFYRLQQPSRPAEAAPFVPGSWSLVVLPDTQIYSESYPELFKDQTRWIVANKDRYNIKYVLHLGDIVNVPMATTQWVNAKAAMSLMDGVVPYAFVTGNHDHGSSGVASDRATIVNTYFPVSTYTSWPTFGGTMEPNHIENSYHLFSAGGVDWLILALEWGPRNSPVAWANQIVTNYPNRKVILITHAYMYYDDMRYDWATKGASQSWNPYSYGTANDPGGTNDGEDLWKKLVKIHPNFVMVFNGHVLNDGLGRLSSTNDFGNVVHQMLVNYQMKALGGEAYLRLVEFLPDGKTVQVKAYSPLYGTYKTDPQNQFILTLQPPLQ